MRALRSSCYTHPFEPPVTTVLLESDAVDTLESIRHRLLAPGALVIHEIFEAAEDDIETATLQAVERQQANAVQEAHQAMLFFWAASQWNRVKVPGALVMDKPAPLSHEEYEVALAQLAQHPERPAISIFGVSGDGYGLCLTPDGNIIVEPLGDDLGGGI